MKLTKEQVTEKIRSCKSLQGKTIADIVNSLEFTENLARLMQVQKSDRERTIAIFQKQGRQVTKHVVDDILKMSLQAIAQEYLIILAMRSNASKERRQYISQICRQAYNYTIMTHVVAEFPELREYFLPNSGN